MFYRRWLVTDLIFLKKIKSYKHSDYWRKIFCSGNIISTIIYFLYIIIYLLFIYLHKEIKHIKVAYWLIYSPDLSNLELLLGFGLGLKSWSRLSSGSGLEMRIGLGLELYL